MTQQAHILLFIPEFPALDHGVLHAQVLSVARFLTERNYICHFMGVEKSYDRAEMAIQQISTVYNIPTHIFDIYPKHPTAFTLAKTAKNLAGKAEAVLKEIRPTHIYSRGCISSFFARRLARKYSAISIYDVRGALGEEVLLRRNNTILSYLTKKIENFEIEHTDKVATVSQNLAEYIQKETGRKDVTVIPSIFDETMMSFNEMSRVALRQQFRIRDNEYLICYSGGLSKWQRVSDIIDLLQQCMTIEPRIKTLFLTREKSSLETLLYTKSFPASQYIIEECPHEKINQYLSAADAGIIMREDTLVNNVASPIKVAEYLGCGLPVILTKGIGDYSQTLSGAGVGLLLDTSSNMAQQIVNFLHGQNFSTLRNKAIAYAHSHLTMSSNLHHYEKLYTSTN